MSKKFLSLLLLFLSNTIYAQYNIDRINTSPKLANRISISGIAILNHKLYMAAERCKKIFIADLTTNQITDTLQLICADTLEIEGLTAFGSELYCVSESNSKTYHINLQTGVLTALQIDIDIKKLIGIFRGDGLEGIAANTQSNLFYLLLERNATKDLAEVFTFEIAPNSMGAELKLVFKKSDKLVLDSAEVRYSDLCYDAKEKRLLLIKSSYKNKIGTYSIQTLALDNDGLPKGLPHVFENVDTGFLTKAVTNFQNLGFDSNLEGIAIDAKNTLYLISDNAMGEADCESNNVKSSKQTLVLELIKY